MAVWITARATQTRMRHILGPRIRDSPHLFCYVGVRRTPPAAARPFGIAEDFSPKEFQGAPDPAGGGAPRTPPAAARPPGIPQEFFPEEFQGLP